MVELTTPSRRTLIISISAVVGIVTVSSLAYLYIRDNKRSTHSRQFRSLQRKLYSQLLKAQDTLDDLVENDLRLIQIRVKTLRSHRLYPGDTHVQLPALGLLNEQDKYDLGTDLIEESKEEMIREHTLGFEDHARVRHGYKELDRLVNALHKQLVRLLERVDGMDLSELAELGDDVVVTDRLTKEEGEENGSAFQALDKIRKRRRQVMAGIQKVIARLERIRACYKDRLQSIRDFEKLEGLGLEPEDDVVPTVDSEMMKQGVTFADITKANIEEPEILAPTEDLERMKQGVTFADVVAENLPEETGATEVLKPTEDLEKMKHGVTFADVVAEGIEEDKRPENERVEKEKEAEEVLAPTEDLKKMQEGVTFADVVAENTEPPAEHEVLAPTEDLELMKKGVTFADVVAENSEPPADHEVLAPTEDLELMKKGVSFAEIAKHNIETPSDMSNGVLAPTDDLEKMKHGKTFADAVAEE